MGRKSPTVFVVRLTLDKTAKTVVWSEDASDHEGDLGRTMKTWKGCVFLDDENWECAPVTIPDGSTVEHASMRNGELRHRYWTEERVYRLRRRLGRVSF